jgi:hypothetical protein
MNREDRFKLLAALSDTILPGATEAHAAEYVERALGQRSGQEQAVIENGLDLVDSMARQTHGKVFADCSLAERSDILERLRCVPHRIVLKFLARITGLVIEGFLCHPSHGGNRGGAGWRAVGYS